MTNAGTQPDAHAELGPEGHQPVHTRALIIGTGFSGLGMAIALQRQGIDFVILEKADDIGGTWRDNSYPGCACDIPSHLYSFSFEPKPDWMHLFSYQPEIWDYLKGVTEKYGLRRYIVFNSLVDRGHWDEDEYRWHVFTSDGREYVAQFLISGAGALHIPSIPDIEGRDEFCGPAFHSAHWDHGVDLTGKRVAMIGTGASAIQIVPEIVRQVAELQLYQRTPPWVVPRINVELPLRLRRALTNVPGLRALLRAGIYWAHEALAYGMTKRPNTLKIIEALAKWNIRHSVKDRELRRKLVPHYRIGCKRILNSSSYYRAVANPKTELVTEAISRITRDGIVTVDGTGREVFREVDVIVYGTGFHVTDSYTYVQIKGRHGEDLVDRWNREGIAAHRGIAVADMPNLFFLLGPNTGLGHNSVVFMIESQIRYVVDAISTCDRLGAQALAPTRAAQDRFNDELQRNLAHSVWNSGGCRSWYLDEHGKNTVLWGGYTWQYWRGTRSVKPTEYQFFGVGMGSSAQHAPLTVAN
ncbi:putative monooxygenase [Mycobacterium haemophilum DSM 44634]|uniref:flavin-containing monooxygenase n=1 Tax=Mycobacterium haemophilum TaxID=29311 RepID=UPI0006557AC7|nr:NAD(P)/FAD-dependent oxidoreductase [Mycobacterium haemophilum]AKN17729.1 4-hydroxyacetophenone monooxygenase [Mycobacterium haemophilum DSM 44634]MCV7341917.1 NAD(P)/FAD-dependent oxidoreductase [Mycobacterium haemophilum DSM 44634]